jgi:hypothetical protein
VRGAITLGHTADIFAIAVGVEPNEIPPNPEQTTAAS